MSISKKERNTLIAFAKVMHPIGSVIIDSVRSQPYTIKKNSVFTVIEDEYADEFKPKKNEDIFVSFLVRDPGKNSELYLLGWLPKGWCLKLSRNTDPIPGCE